MIKEPSFGTRRRFSTCFLTLSLRTTPIDVFPDYFSFSRFLHAFCSLKNKKTKFIKICTDFRIKQATFLPSKCTSFLLRSKPLQ